MYIYSHAQTDRDKKWVSESWEKEETLYNGRFKYKLNLKVVENIYKEKTQDVLTLCIHKDP